MALRLLKSVLPRPKLSEEDAIAIVAYHLERNRIAKDSHRKSWLERYKNVEFKVLL